MFKRLFRQRSEALDNLPADGPIVITVHGTNDADVRDDGMRWWQQGSRFTTRLVEKLGELGFSGAHILPVHWSGANSDHDRLIAAEELSRVLTSLERSGRPHAVIGHSHGGNVVMEALALRRRRQPLSSVITFGTPFFVRRLKPIAGLIAIFQVLLGLVVAPVMAWFLASSFTSGTNKIVEAVILFGGLIIFSLWSLRRGFLELSRAGWTRRHSAHAIHPQNWLVVHSPRDEAMRLLEAAADISPDYVTVASAIRSISRLSTVVGVAAVIIFFGATWSYFLEPIITKANAGEFGIGMAADLTFLLIVPVIFSVIVFVIRLVARLGGGWLYASVLNFLIHGSLMGAAYGGDARFRLTHVVRTPPYVSGAEESRIDATNLGGIDETAILNSAQDLYQTLIAQDGAEVGFGDPDKLWKRLSDALYHNAYMRDENVIANTADHIASRWSR
ncbi:hypothetical protein SAMN04488061_0923 [Filomicrobium insigne]|uniref:AB hydrolase-1 domain-containing protein n=1 Tax=Filomicrobium insigne TaxID=418854 RepID=A0A1H0IQE6_9HYPH|nr:hypothetical protein [Filomicrobium insigne]SDO33626.1 hypothetical protein SAMN04488061_0923 [Filomicrobium insigne]